MNVQQVQSNQNFEARQRFLNEAQKKNINILIEKMGKEAKYETDGMFFKHTRTNRLTIPKKAEFVCARILKDTDCDKVHFTVDKTELVIDTPTGKIENFYKPFFTRWSKVMENVDKYLNIFMENFNNSKVVQKDSFTISGMTPEAFEIYKREVDKLFEECRRKK
jgi:hypothetical protein